MTAESSEKIILFDKKQNTSLIEKNALKRNIHKYKEKLEEARKELSENEITFRTLAKNIDRIKLNTQKEISKRISSEVFPLLSELKSDKISDKTRAKLEVIITRLNMIMPIPSNPYRLLTSLSPMEVRIASMIKDGYKSRDIASLLCISLDTVKTHRRNIRLKLKLSNKPISLSSYLKNIHCMEDQ
jgi:DNA-binding CsgD family transcriptional regulator